jgi:hypothetical protein
VHHYLYAWLSGQSYAQNNALSPVRQEQAAVNRRSMCCQSPSFDDLSTDIGIYFKLQNIWSMTIVL